jgi:hypothetical protein
MWARPLNDNYDVQDGDYSGNNKKSYLDNVDLFALTLPLTQSGGKVYDAGADSIGIFVEILGE